MFKTMMLAAIAVFMVTIISLAQPKLSPKERAKALTEKLSLTKDQAAKIEKILVQSQEEMKKMKADGKADKSELKMKRDETQAKIENVLDDKQKAEFKKMQDEMRKEKKDRKSGMNPDNKEDSK
jgi:hypothetical protein